MTRNPLMAAIGATYNAFDFLTPTPRLPFAVTMLKFAAAFLAGWLIQLSGLLSPGIVRGNEVLVALLVVLFLPVVAALTRRLTDARMPLILSVLPLLLLGAASASTVMFDWPMGTTILRWAALVAALALGAALCMPGRAAPQLARSASG